MPRTDLNRSGDMEVFVHVVERGSFSAAARALRMTPSAVSKLVARLEARLGARLLNRSTRSAQLTPEGKAFFERSVRILGDIDAAEREVSAEAAPRGRLRVNANVPFGRRFLLPSLPRFLERHPQITVDVALTDVMVDLFAVRADVAIRTGPLRDSQLHARKLGETRMVVVAAPAYLERHGVPRTPADLARHNCVRFCFARHVEAWPFRERSGGRVSVIPSGNTLVGDGEAMRQLVVSGLGIGRLASFQVEEDVRRGRLVRVLASCDPGITEPVHAVFIGKGGKLAARVRVFLDHLVETVDLG